MCVSFLFDEFLKENHSLIRLIFFRLIYLTNLGIYKTFLVLEK